MNNTIITFIATISFSILHVLTSPTGCYATKFNSAPRDYSIAPPAPQVAALMEFKDYPVDYFRGTPHRLSNTAVATEVNAATDRLHIGNRYLSHSGLNLYDNTARMHDPLLMRFTTPDPLFDKYPDISPWAHTAANPLNYIDMYGDSIQVATNDQNLVNESLSAVFGDKAQNFSYTSSGMLVFNGNTKGMNGNQKDIFKGLSKLMSNSVNTIVHIGKEMTIKDINGVETTKYASEGGGALSVTITDNPTYNENHILVDPNVKSVKVYELINQTTSLKKNAHYELNFIDTNPTDLLIHELGEVIFQKERFGPAKALLFNNKARNLLKMKKRKFDEEHNFITK